MRYRVFRAVVSLSLAAGAAAGPGSARAAPESAPDVEAAERPVVERARAEAAAGPPLPVDDIRPNIVGESADDDWDATRIINTDRPDFTDVLPTVPPGGWQIESGYTFRRASPADGNLTRHQTPEALLRVGLFDRFELRARIDGYLFTDRGTGAATPAPAGDLLLGFKWEALRQRGWIPALTVIGVVTNRASATRRFDGGVMPGANLVYGWQLTRWLVLRGSTGVDMLTTRAPASRLRPFAEIHQSAVAYWQISKRLGAYTEWYALFDVGAVQQSQHFAGTGLYVYITPDVQLDARFGHSVAGTSEWFTGAGISARGRLFEPATP